MAGMVALAVAVTGGGVLVGLALGPRLVPLVGLVSATDPAPSEPRRSGSSPSPGATATPAPARPAPPRMIEPSTPPHPDQRDPDRTRKTNSVYAVTLPATLCRIRVRATHPPIDDDELAGYLRSLVRCLRKVYAEPLARQGFALKTPRVKAFRSSVRSPCGRITAESAPAAYCGSSRTIYVSVSSDDVYGEFSLARLGYLEMAAHEFAHHVQASTGILSDFSGAYADASRSGRYALTRRAELQADCFAGASLTALAVPIGLSDRDRGELREARVYTGDEDPPQSRRPDHGTSKAQQRWLMRGMDGADLGRCNTWKASKRSVT